MKAGRGLAALALLFAAAQSCTNDFDQFEVTGNAGATTGGKSSVGGSTATAGTTSVSTAGKGGSTTTGGTTSSGGTAGTGGGLGGTGGASEAGAAGVGGVGCALDQKDCGTCVPLNDPTTGCGAEGDCAPCTLAHASATCDGENLCAVGQCDWPYADCDTGAGNGCEIDISTTPASCGSCGNDCTAQGLNACVDQLCACASKSDCGSNNPGVDCVGGRCECDNTACRPGEVCAGSGGDPRVCSCNGGTGCLGSNDLCCEGVGCVDGQTSAANCGACGRACTAGFICAAGSCACDSAVDCGAEPSGAAGASGVAGAAGATGSAGVTGDGGAGGATVAPIACTVGLCVCNGTTCAEGQRCQPDGSCG